MNDDRRDPRWLLGVMAVGLACWALAIYGLASLVRDLGELAR